MAPKKKFSRENKQPLPDLNVSPLLDGAEAEATVHRHVEEINKRLDLLSDHYETLRGDYWSLALALAEEFVFHKKPGRPKKWNFLALGVLNVEVRRILDDETLPGASVTSALEHLATQERWQKFLEETEGIGSDTDPAAALKVRYYESCKNPRWSGTAWEAYQYNCVCDTIQKWEDYVDDVLFGGPLVGESL